MCKQTLKEVVKEMCKAFPGGRSAMAGALGISETTFNNKLYEKMAVVSLKMMSLKLWRNYQVRSCWWSITWTRWFLQQKLSLRI